MSFIRVHLVFFPLDWLPRVSHISDIGHNGVILCWSLSLAHSLPPSIHLPLTPIPLACRLRKRHVCILMSCLPNNSLRPIGAHCRLSIYAPWWGEGGTRSTARSNHQSPSGDSIPSARSTFAPKAPQCIASCVVHCLTILCLYLQLTQLTLTLSRESIRSFGGGRRQRALRKLRHKLALSRRALILSLSFSGREYKYPCEVCTFKLGTLYQA